MQKNIFIQTLFFFLFFLFIFPTIFAQSDDVGLKINDVNYFLSENVFMGNLSLENTTNTLYLVGVYLDDELFYPILDEDTNNPYADEELSVSEFELKTLLSNLVYDKSNFEEGGIFSLIKSCQDAESEQEYMYYYNLYKTKMSNFFNISSLEYSKYIQDLFLGDYFIINYVYISSYTPSQQKTNMDFVIPGKVIDAPGTLYLFGFQYNSPHANYAGLAKENNDVVLQKNFLYSKIERSGFLKYDRKYYRKDNYLFDEPNKDASFFKKKINDNDLLPQYESLVLDYPVYFNLEILFQGKTLPYFHEVDYANQEIVLRILLDNLYGKSSIGSSKFQFMFTFFEMNLDSLEWSENDLVSLNLNEFNIKLVGTSAKKSIIPTNSLQLRDVTIDDLTKGFSLTLISKTDPHKKIKLKIQPYISDLSLSVESIDPEKIFPGYYSNILNLALEAKTNTKKLILTVSNYSDFNKEDYIYFYGIPRTPDFKEYMQKDLFIKNDVDFKEIDTNTIYFCDVNVNENCISNTNIVPYKYKIKVSKLQEFNSKVEIVFPANTRTIIVGAQYKPFAGNVDRLDYTGPISPAGFNNQKFYDLADENTFLQNPNYELDYLFLTPFTFLPEDDTFALNYRNIIGSRSAKKIVNLEVTDEFYLDYLGGLLSNLDVFNLSFNKHVSSGVYDKIYNDMYYIYILREIYFNKYLRYVVNPNPKELQKLANFNSVIFDVANLYGLTEEETAQFWAIIAQTSEYGTGGFTKEEDSGWAQIDLKSYCNSEEVIDKGYISLKDYFNKAKFSDNNFNEIYPFDLEQELVFKKEELQTDPEQTIYTELPLIGYIEYPILQDTLLSKEISSKIIPLTEIVSDIPDSLKYVSFLDFSSLPKGQQDKLLSLAKPVSELNNTNIIDSSSNQTIPSSQNNDSIEAPKVYLVSEDRTPMRFLNDVNDGNFTKDDYVSLCNYMKQTENINYKNYASVLFAGAVYSRDKDKLIASPSNNTQEITFDKNVFESYDNNEAIDAAFILFYKYWNPNTKFLAQNKPFNISSNLTHEGVFQDIVKLSYYLTYKMMMHNFDDAIIQKTFIEPYTIYNTEVLPKSVKHALTLNLYPFKVPTPLFETKDIAKYNYCILKQKCMDLPVGYRQCAGFAVKFGNRYYDYGTDSSGNKIKWESANAWDLPKKGRGDAQVLWSWEYGKPLNLDHLYPGLILGVYVGENRFRGKPVPYSHAIFYLGNYQDMSDAFVHLALNKSYMYSLNAYTESFRKIKVVLAPPGYYSPEELVHVRNYLTSFD